MTFQCTFALSKLRLANERKEQKPEKTSPKFWSNQRKGKEKKSLNLIHLRSKGFWKRTKPLNGMWKTCLSFHIDQYIEADQMQTQTSGFN